MNQTFVSDAPECAESPDWSCRAKPEAMHDEASVFDDERINNGELNCLRAKPVSRRETALNFAKVTAWLTCKFYRSEYTDAKGLRLK